MNTVNTRQIFVRIATPEDADGRTTDCDVRLRADLRDGESPIDLLAIMLAANINAHRLPRPYYLLAHVIQQLQQWGWSHSETNHGRAEEALLQAAIDVVEAWHSHDLKHNKSQL